LRFTPCRTTRSPRATSTFRSSKNAAGFSLLSPIRPRFPAAARQAPPARLNGVESMRDLANHVIPQGFRFAAARAGLKASGRPDFAVVVADTPAGAAAAFTSNRVVAAP